MTNKAYKASVTPVSNGYIVDFLNSGQLVNQYNCKVCLSLDDVKVVLEQGLQDINQKSDL